MERPITKETSVEDLLDLCPAANGHLIERGLPCIVCGEPFWGSVGDLARRYGIDDVDGLVDELNALVVEAPGSRDGGTGEER